MHIENIKRIVPYILGSGIGVVISTGTLLQMNDATGTFIISSMIFFSMIIGIAIIHMGKVLGDGNSFIEIQNNIMHKGEYIKPKGSNIARLLHAISYGGISVGAGSFPAILLGKIESVSITTGVVFIVISLIVSAVCGVIEYPPQFEEEN